MSVARLYNLARQGVAGYEAYADLLCGSCDDNCEILESVIDSLFHLAKAEGLIHERELAFLGCIAEIIYITDDHFDTIIVRHARIDVRDPYSVLGVSPYDDFSDICRRYRSLVAEHHPNKRIVRGMRIELHVAAKERMAALNAAYSPIEKELRFA